MASKAPDRTRKLTITIDSTSHAPVSMQIADHIRKLIFSGKLSAGDELPSVRDIARDLAVNPMTVSKAFQRLAAEGVLAKRRGMTMTVATPDQPVTASHSVVEAALRVVFSAALDEALKLEISAEVITEVFLRLVDERQAAVPVSD